jgi:hypothetical protein
MLVIHFERMRWHIKQRLSKYGSPSEKICWQTNNNDKLISENYRVYPAPMRYDLKIKAYTIEPFNLLLTQPSPFAVRNEIIAQTTLMR